MLLYKFTYGGLTLYAWLSQVILLSYNYTISWSEPLDKSKFGLLRFRSPLLTESINLSFPLGTKMFQFPRCAFNRYKYQWWYILIYRVPPFRDRRIIAYTSSPSLIAGSRVFHRLLVPRHPLYALINLTSKILGLHLCLNDQYVNSQFYWLLNDFFCF